MENKTYKPTIGIEVHAELKTKTKMFCGSLNAPHGSEANTHVCPVCLAHPGTLPVINKEAVRHVLKMGIAVEGSLATYTEFDRKNYFYPDIPKGYQISQYKYPLVSGGELASVELTRIHLEEDTARSLHDQGEGSIVDYNRAGVPLMELVTEPVIHDSETAVTFVRELQLLLRSIEVSDANMEKGEMRIEANISVSSTDTLGTKVEVKNLNSFKSFENAIKYEIKRQIESIDKGEEIIQETRGWDENRDKTFSQRSKEAAEEYRYFPDPDLPSLDLSHISDFALSRLSEETASTPEKRRLKLKDLGLPREQIEVIISDISLANFFDEVCKLNSEKEFVKLAANYASSDSVSVLSGEDKSFGDVQVSSFVELIQMLVNDDITSRVAKDLLPRILFSSESPRKLAESEGLLQDNSEDALDSVVMEVIKENDSVVNEYKAGKEASIQFLIGQGMKKTKGSANPGLLKSLLEKEIKGS